MEQKLNLITKVFLNEESYSSVIYNDFLNLTNSTNTIVLLHNIKINLASFLKYEINAVSVFLIDVVIAKIMEINNIEEIELFEMDIEDLTIGLNLHNFSPSFALLLFYILKSSRLAENSRLMCKVVDLITSTDENEVMTNFRSHVLCNIKSLI